MAAGKDLRVVAELLQELERVVGRLGPLVLEQGGDHALAPFALWMALYTRSGVVGISMSVTPRGARASMTALTTAGGAAMVPASPMPFTPNGLVVEGVTVESRVNDGSSAAEGTR